MGVKFPAVKICSMAAIEVKIVFKNLVADYGVAMTSLTMIGLAILFSFFSLISSLVVLCLFSSVLAIAKLIFALLFGSHLVI